jgi:hypothetical protein
VSCVERDVHRIALCLALLTATARAQELADGDEGFVGAPGRAISIGMVGHAHHLGGVDEGGVGADIEYALGSDRTQYFAELTWSSEKIAAMQGASSGATGTSGRGGVGVRWLARQFQLDHGGGMELFLEAVTGVERIWWEDGGRLTRPDLGLGVGLQGRAWAFHGFTVRLGSRVMFAPTDRDSSLIACRGTGCPMGTSTSIAGFMTGIVFGW